MATLYVAFKTRMDGQAADAHEKLTIGATDSATAGLSVAKNGGVELHTDTVCLVAINLTGATTSGAFYAYPGIRYWLNCGPGLKVATKTA